MPATLAQYSKIIQNPSRLELQKAANQGRRSTWEKLSAIKANCGIELALDECVTLLNHMRRLKRSAERAAASTHGPSSPVYKRIPSWYSIARENSTGSIAENAQTDLAPPLRQEIGHLLFSPRHKHNGNECETENSELSSWTRLGGPLMKTTSSNKLVEFFRCFDSDQTLAKESLSHSLRVTIPDMTSDTRLDQMDLSNRLGFENRSIVVSEGDLLEMELSPNAIFFNVLKKGDFTPTNSSPSIESNKIQQTSVGEDMQLVFPENETDSSSTSDCEDC